MVFFLYRLRDFCEYKFLSLFLSLSLSSLFPLSSYKLEPLTDLNAVCYFLQIKCKNLHVPIEFLLIAQVEQWKKSQFIGIFTSITGTNKMISHSTAL